MKFTHFLVALIVLSSQVFSQQIGVWKNYSDMKQVRDAHITADGFWAATSGGAFFFNKSDSSYLQINNVDYSGIRYAINNITAIDVDNSGNVWICNNNGLIDVYSPSTGTFVKRILDLFQSKHSRKQITNIHIQGDTAYVSTDFGMSLINTRTFNFYDTFLKLGSFPSETKVNKSLQADVLYLATANGVAKQKYGTTNLSAPESWENYTSANGLPSDSVISIVKYGALVIASTKTGLSSFDGTSWQRYLPGNFSGMAKDLAVLGDTLIVIQGRKVFFLTQAGFLQAYPDFTADINKFISLRNGEITVATNSGIISSNSAGSMLLYSPPGPVSNLFSSIAVDRLGNLWSTSGYGSGGTGASYFDKNNWKVFNNVNTPQIIYNSFHKLYVAPDNSVYLLNWGAGFTRYKDGRFTTYSTRNTNIIGTFADPKFLVISSAATDSKGNLWYANFLERDIRSLGVITSDSTFHFIKNKYFSKVQQTYDLVIDQYDTKWFITSDFQKATGQTLLYFNENKTIDNNDDDLWGIFNNGNGLNSDAVNTIALDRRGELWIGTSAGINVIQDTRNPRPSQVYSMRSQVVTAIAVDALNQKWVGTQHGVYLLSSDGTEILAHYTTENSPLPTDIIKAVAIDHSSGMVYFGTDFGLASLSSTSVAPSEGFTEMFVFPNPVLIDAAQPVVVTVQGLVRDSEIKILSISGSLVNSFVTPGGGVATWNGKDKDGNYVPSGVYLIVAYDKEGNNVASAKVAVVRK